MTVDLHGWKAIADTLSVSVRTAQRFRIYGMPVSRLTVRHVVASREAVIGWRDERIQAMKGGTAQAAGFGE